MAKASEYCEGVRTTPGGPLLCAERDLVRTTATREDAFVGEK